MKELDWTYDGEGMHVLGVAVGEAQYREQQAFEKIEQDVLELRDILNIARTRAPLERNNGTQGLLRLLCERFVQKAIFVIQNYPLNMTEELIRAYLEAICRSWCELVHLNYDDLSELQKEQLITPTSSGGMGICNLPEMAKYLRFGTLTKALPVVLTVTKNTPAIPELDILITEISQDPGLSDELKTELKVIHEANNRKIENFVGIPKDLQKLSNRLSAINKTRVVNSWQERMKLGMDNESLDRLESINSPESGRILNMNPSIYKIQDKELNVYIRRRLGIAITVTSHEICPHCESNVDILVEHAQKCKHIGRNTIHHYLNKMLFLKFHKLAEKNSLNVTYEPNLTHLLKEGNTTINPRGDIGILCPTINKLQILDLTCVAINGNVNGKESSVAQAEERKKQTYLKNFEFGSIQLVTLAIDSYGRNGVQMSKFLTEFAQTVCLSEKDYNRVISDIRNTVQLHHAIAVNRQVAQFINLEGANSIAIKMKRITADVEITPLSDLD